MRRALLRIAFAVALVSVACTSGGKQPTASEPNGDQAQAGGTLRIATLRYTTEDLDPTTYTGGGLMFELFRCCLLRTLVSYNGKSADEGGSVLRPDLADGMPEVSSDGLTWTFRLKRGLHYAPPFADTEIVAGDVVRALEREADPKVNPPSVDGFFSYVFYYSVIEGLDAFWRGEANAISGLETPNDHTLVVHLIEPTGDLPDRFSMGATAPIPEGAARGHQKDYFRYLAASGPYVIEGSEDLDASMPPEEQEPVSGFVPRRSLTLVRNPSWSADTDDLRPAFADRIEVTMYRETPRNVADLGRQIDEGLLDLSLVGSPTELIDRYLEDPTLRDRVHVDRSNVGAYVGFNLALPPFDDVHVRRASVLALDRRVLARLMDEYLTNRGTTLPTWHIAPDGIEADLLADWQPSWSGQVGSGGSFSAARAEMARSRYDGDADGRCDDPACRGVSMVVNDPYTVESAVARGLEQIGITFDITVVPFAAAGRTFGAPSSQVINLGALPWIADFPNGSTFFVPLFTGASITERWNLNGSLLGATPEQLDSWGYAVDSVPSADDRIARCASLTGQVQTSCWAELDQYLMEDVVSAIPLGESRYTYVVADRVTSYSFSQTNTTPAFDRIALAPGSE